MQWRQASRAQRNTRRFVRFVYVYQTAKPKSEAELRMSTNLRSSPDVRMSGRRRRHRVRRRTRWPSRSRWWSCCARARLRRPPPRPAPTAAEKPLRGAAPPREPRAPVPRARQRQTARRGEKPMEKG
eukprot:4922509-Pleurochrysis_carterae.AAC.2